MADKINLKRILKLMGISAKMDLAWLLRDTKYAVAGISADVISNLSAVSGVFLIASRFGGIGGMSADEVLFMMAYSTLITGIFMLFGGGNVIHVSRIIGRGQLEHAFIQPLPLAAQLSTAGFQPFTGGSNFVVGVVMMGVAVHRLDIAVTFPWILEMTGYLLVTMVIIVARAYLVSSMAFYAPVACEEISTSVIEGTWFLSNFPLGGMPPFVLAPLLTVMPEGLMAWFPAMCLLGRPPLHLTAFYPVFFALILSLLASYLFRKGMRHYVRVGSNRYVPWGFRR